MSLGLKRGTVILEDYDSNWKIEANKTIDVLKKVLKDRYLGIEHIGSTAIKGFKAKPIIDIVIGVNDYDSILEVKDELEKNNIIFRNDDRPRELLFCIGNYLDNFVTHHIHVVLYDTEEFNKYIDFRDCLNSNIELRNEYLKEKESLERKYSNDRKQYTKEKSIIIEKILNEYRKYPR
jgi:GrpB-like predicted nucleotidyltransferase (UPF0157 family)